MSSIYDGEPCCMLCTHAYREDKDWFSLESMIQYNVDVACGLINPNDRHVSSFEGHQSRCEKYAPSMLPIRVFLERPHDMVKAGRWWTDKEEGPEQTTKRTVTLDDWVRTNGPEETIGPEVR